MGRYVVKKYQQYSIVHINLETFLTLIFSIFQKCLSENTFDNLYRLLAEVMGDNLTAAILDFKYRPLRSFTKAIAFCPQGRVASSCSSAYDTVSTKRTIKARVTTLPHRVKVCLLKNRKSPAAIGTYESSAFRRALSRCGGAFAERRLNIKGSRGVE